MHHHHGDHRQAQPFVQHQPRERHGFERREREQQSKVEPEGGFQSHEQIQTVSLAKSSEPTSEDAERCATNYVRRVPAGMLAPQTTVRRIIPQFVPREEPAAILFAFLPSRPA